MSSLTYWEYRALKWNELCIVNLFITRLKYNYLMGATQLTWFELKCADMCELDQEEISVFLTDLNSLGKLRQSYYILT